MLIFTFFASLVEVEQSLAKLPLAMAKFSSMTRSLFGVNQATGKDEGGKAFLEVRNIFAVLLCFYRTQVSLGSGLWVPASLTTGAL